LATGAAGGGGINALVNVSLGEIVWEFIAAEISADCDDEDRDDDDDEESDTGTD
jgi:hypothetical protein